ARNPSRQTDRGVCAASGETPMKAFIIAICVFGPAVSGFAEQPVPVPATAPASGETMNQLSRSAEQQLATSIQELNQLRDQLAGEKLPLAPELTTLEEKLAALRRKQTDVTRQVDTSNLDITVIKSEIKARQDELSYVGNLLDEYARTFETKINVSELQYLGK